MSEPCNHMVGTAVESYQEAVVFANEWDESGRNLYGAFYTRFSPFNFCPSCGIGVSSIAAEIAPRCHPEIKD